MHGRAADAVAQRDPHTDAATREHPRRIDYEYERAGAANIFMFTEPLAGWRQVGVRPTKTKADWALEIGDSLRWLFVVACVSVSLRKSGTHPCVSLNVCDLLDLQLPFSGRNVGLFRERPRK
ncbi:MAG: hypothetical protein ACYC26_10385 [Phycisphaerales bacterium]